MKEHLVSYLSHSEVIVFILASKIEPQKTSKSLEYRVHLLALKYVTNISKINTIMKRINMKYTFFHILNTGQDFPFSFSLTTYEAKLNHCSLSSSPCLAEHFNINIGSYHIIQGI